jgi:hypothetical protein
VIDGRLAVYSGEFGSSDYDRSGIRARARTLAPCRLLSLARISWMCPITEVVSLLSDVPGSDVDLAWECQA